MTDRQEAAAAVIGLGGYMSGDIVRILRGAYAGWLGCLLIRAEDARHTIWRVYFEETQSSVTFDATWFELAND